MTSHDTCSGVHPDPVRARNDNAPLRTPVGARLTMEVKRHVVHYSRRSSYRALVAIPQVSFMVPLKRLICMMS